MSSSPSNTHIHHTSSISVHTWPDTPCSPDQVLRAHLTRYPVLTWPGTPCSPDQVLRAHPAVLCLEEWIGNSTGPLQRTKEGHLQIKRKSATFYQIVMQMALSGQTYAYLVAHMPKNPVLHCYWREHMHVELLEFNAEYQDLCRGWVRVLSHRWSNICLVPFAAHWNRNVKPTSVQRLCSLDDMDDQEYDGLRYRHGDLFTQAAAMHGEDNLAIIWRWTISLTFSLKQCRLVSRLSYKLSTSLMISCTMPTLVHNYSLKRSKHLEY